MSTKLQPEESVDRGGRGWGGASPRIAATGVGAVLVILVLAWLWPFHSVPTGTRGVVTQFGAIKGIENEGLVVLPPWESLTIFSIRAETETVDGAEGSTFDTQPVHVNLTVRYAISPDKVAWVFEHYSHNGNLSSYVSSGTQEVFKAVTARYTAPELIAKRQEVSVAINKALAEKLAIYGAQVLNVDMRNFAFQDSYMRAINSKVEQEQLKLAAENKLLTVEAEQKQKVAIAEAEAAAVRATADGENYRVKKQAEADAYQIKVKQEALATQGQALLELKRIEVAQTQAEKWNGQLPTAIYAGAPIPFMQTK